MKKGFIVCVLFLLIVLISFLSSVSASSSDKISTRQKADGTWEFYNTRTGNSFIPMGNNFVWVNDTFFISEFAGHNFSQILLHPAINFSYEFNTNGTVVTLAPTYYNSTSVYNNISNMSERGYNVVRIFLDNWFHTSGLVTYDPSTGIGDRLNDSYMENVINFTKTARANNLHVIFSFGYLPETYYDIVNQSCSPGYPNGENYGTRLVNISNNFYEICGQNQSDKFNELFIHAGDINATKTYILDVLKKLNNSDPNLINTTFGIEMMAEPYFTNDTLPFNITTGTITITLQNTETYNMDNPNSRQGLADNATKYWIDNIAKEVNQGYPNLLITSGLFAPYGAFHSGYNGVGPSMSGVNDPRQPHRVKVYANSSYIDYLDIHLYQTPISEIFYNISTAMNTAELNKSGIFNDGTKLNKPLIMSEFGADKTIYPSIAEGVDAIVSHQINSCEYRFGGWLLWTWDLIGGHWTAIENNYAIAKVLSPFSVPDPCLRNRFIMKLSSGSTTVLDHSNVAWLDNGGNIVLNKSCIENISACNPSPGSNAFVIQNSSGWNVSFVQETGSLCVRSGCLAPKDCSNPGDNSFIIKDDSGRNALFINNTGDLCYNNTLVSNN